VVLPGRSRRAPFCRPWPAPSGALDDMPVGRVATSTRRAISVPLLTVRDGASRSLLKIRPSVATPKVSMCARRMATSSGGMRIEQVSSAGRCLSPRSSCAASLVRDDLADVIVTVLEHQFPRLGVRLAAAAQPGADDRSDGVQSPHPASSRFAQCAAPSGTSSRVRTTTSSTWASVIVRGTPGHGSSGARPASHATTGSATCGPWCGRRPAVPRPPRCCCPGRRPEQSVPAAPGRAR
jgi:hypothetical protein